MMQGRWLNELQLGNATQMLIALLKDFNAIVNKNYDINYF